MGRKYAGGFDTAAVTVILLFWSTGNLFAENEIRNEGKAPVQPLPDSVKMITHPDGTVSVAECEERRTVVAEKNPEAPPATLAPFDPSQETWEEYEQRVLVWIGVVEGDPVDSPDMSDGCALEEWETDSADVPIEDRDVQVLQTELTIIRTKEGEDVHESVDSGSPKRDGASFGTPSGKTNSENPVPARIQDMFAVKLLAAMGVAAACVIGLRYLALLILGRIFRRKRCLIAAELFTDEQVFPGKILILGKRGCRFVPDDHDVLEQYLDTPEFLRFFLAVSDLQLPVFVNLTSGTAVSVFFDCALCRDKQGKMLICSEIEV